MADMPGDQGKFLVLFNKTPVFIYKYGTICVAIVRDPECCTAADDEIGQSPETIRRWFRQPPGKCSIHNSIDGEYPASHASENLWCCVEYQMFQSDCFFIPHFRAISLDDFDTIIFRGVMGGGYHCTPVELIFDKILESGGREDPTVNNIATHRKHP